MQGLNNPEESRIIIHNRVKRMPVMDKDSMHTTDERKIDHEQL